MVAMTGDTASESFRILQIFFILFCPPAGLSARVGSNTLEQGLYSFAARSQRQSLSTSIIAEERRLAMSHIIDPQEDVVFL
jgi:hypothetical protein